MEIYRKDAITEVNIFFLMPRFQPLIILEGF